MRMGIEVEEAVVAAWDRQRATSGERIAIAIRPGIESETHVRALPDAQRGIAPVLLGSGLAELRKANPFIGEGEGELAILGGGFDVKIGPVAERTHGHV